VAQAGEHLPSKYAKEEKKRKKKEKDNVEEEMRVAMSPVTSRFETLRGTQLLLSN
jgi:hypothetical protein